MARKAKRVAVYLRVSTDKQTVENQRRELTAAAEQRGWQVVAEYADEGISGSRGRKDRPGLDAMLKDATRGRFDVVMAWSVDRLGRSIVDLVNGLQELRSANVDLLLHQQALDTSTSAGRAMFGMMGVFAEFERAMIQERIGAGLARTKAQGVRFGRPTIGAEREDAIRASLAQGIGLNKTAKTLGASVGSVLRVKRQMAQVVPPP